MYEIAWLGLLIIGLCCFFLGYIVSFFMIRNNPKYLNVDRMLKEEIKKRRVEIIKNIQEKAMELK